MFDRSIQFSMGDYFRDYSFLFMRFKRRYARHSSRDKYSIEQTNFVTPPGTDWPVVEAGTETQQQSKQFTIAIVPATFEQGMRKIKHLTISMANNGSDTAPLFYAVVYVPQGYNPQTITTPANGYAAPNYQANQFIMSSGVLDFSAGPTRIRSPLSRNLNSGDAIYLILAQAFPLGTSANFIGQISYAITLQ